MIVLNSLNAFVLKDDIGSNHYDLKDYLVMAFIGLIVFGLIFCLVRAIKISLKERKKAFAIKNEWGTRLAPFAILIDNDHVPIIAFYSEKGNCTSEKINEALHNWIVYGKKIY